eukprot:113155-Amphidinium_carterae.1
MIARALGDLTHVLGQSGVAWPPSLLMRQFRTALSLKRREQVITQLPEHRDQSDATFEKKTFSDQIYCHARQEMYEIMESHEPVLQQFLDAQRTILKTPQLDLDKHAA